MWYDKDNRLKWAFFPEEDFIIQSNNTIKELAGKGLMIYSKDLLIMGLMASLKA